MKVVRLLIYEGTEGQLKSWLEHSLPDGDTGMFVPRGLNITTLFSEIAHDKFGEKRPLVPFEGTNGTSTDQK